MNETQKPGPGRKPPPAKYHFLKGTTGNKRGRPKGSIDTEKLTRKVANKKHAVRVDGRIVRKTLLQLVIESMVREAAAGKPSMVALVDHVRSKISPTQDRPEGGFLLVPPKISEEEFIAEMEAANANARDPTTYVNHKSEEMCKAAQGIYSPLGEAVLACHRRWR
jgi:Family of unknown function (DUF5681)